MIRGEEHHQHVGPRKIAEPILAPIDAGQLKIRGQLAQLQRPKARRVTARVEQRNRGIFGRPVHGCGQRDPAKEGDNKTDGNFHDRGRARAKKANFREGRSATAE